MKMRDRGMIMKPKGSSLELWCNADFCRNWDPDMAYINRSTKKSRIGYIMMFARCPLTWTSKLQMETALSTTKAELIALSQGLRMLTYLYIHQ